MATRLPHRVPARGLPCARAGPPCGSGAALPSRKRMPGGEGRTCRDALSPEGAAASQPQALAPGHNGGRASPPGSWRSGAPSAGAAVAPPPAGSAGPAPRHARPPAAAARPAAHPPCRPAPTCVGTRALKGAPASTRGSQRREGGPCGVCGPPRACGGRGSSPTPITTAGQTAASDGIFHFEAKTWQEPRDFHHYSARSLRAGLEGGALPVGSHLS